MDNSGPQAMDDAIALLNQARWVRDQAIECVSVNAAITNFFCISVSKLNDRVQELAEQSSLIRKSKQENLLELGQQRQLVEEQISVLQSFDREVEEMLDAMESGRILRFPDLTRMSDLISENMGLPRLAAETRGLLARSRTLQDQIAQSLARLEERSKTRSAAYLNRLASGIALIVSIVPLQEFLRQLSRAGLLSLSDCHIAAIVGLVLVSVAILLILRRY